MALMGEVLHSCTSTRGAFTPLVVMASTSYTLVKCQPWRILLIYCWLALLSLPHDVQSFKLRTLPPSTDYGLHAARSGDHRERKSTNTFESESSGWKKSSSPTTAPVANKAKSDDSWKVLMTKLASTKKDDRFAKQIGSSSKALNPNERDDLKCIHFQECAGCTLRTAFTESPVMQRGRAFFSEYNQPFPIHIGNTTAWRTHVKLAVQPMSKWGGLKFGLYKSGTHEVESIPACKVQHPALNEAAEAIRLASIEAGVKGYVAATANRASSGELRYVQLTLERYTNKVQVVLVWNSEDFQSASLALPRLVKVMKARYSNLWQSVTANFNVKTSNNIFDYDENQWRLLWGPAFLREQVGAATFYLRPQIFRQANLDFFEARIIPAVQRHIPRESAVAELYSGIGLLGLNIAAQAQSVYCSDSNPYVAEVFDRCADTLPEADAGKVFFECLDADSAVLQGQCDECDVLVVDPPRRGLNEGVLNFLLDTHEDKKLPARLKRLVYVGCGYDAVERDCRRLTTSGLWKLRAVEGFALFPGSDHVETVMSFDRI